MLKYAFIVVAMTFGYFQTASAQETPPQIIDPETNAPLELLRLDWTFGANDQTIVCAEETYQVPFSSPEGSPAEWFNSGSGGFRLPSFFLNFSVVGTYDVENQQNVNFTRRASGNWSIVDGQIVFACPDGGCAVMPNSTTTDVSSSPVFVPTLGRFAAHLGGDVIAFYSDSTSRLACTAPGRSFRLSAPAMSAVASECTVDMPMNNTGTSNSGNCDYTDAASNAGYGWDPVTMLSCPPLTSGNNSMVSGCDYSAASQNGGWGWNPITAMSCPPL